MNDRQTGSPEWVQQQVAAFLTSMREYGYSAVVAIEASDPISNEAQFLAAGNCTQTLQLGLFERGAAGRKV